MLFGVPLSSLNNYVFVHTFGLGVKGLAYSMSINYFLYFLFLSLYCHFVTNPTVRKAWSLPDLDSLHSWSSLLELGVPGVLLYFVDWGCVYSLGFLSGLIGVLELSVLSCVLTIQRFVTAYATGLQMAATVYVANAIGAQNVKNAKVLAKASILMCLVTDVSIGLFLFLGRNRIGKMFSSDPEVLALFPPAFTAVGFFLVADSMQQVSQGIMKSMGKQNAASALALFGQFFVGLSMSYLLGNKLGYGNPGLLFGGVIGNSLLFILQQHFIWTQDWDQIAAECDEKITVKPQIN
jgi:multidrug resistance protein, MATE family